MNREGKKGKKGENEGRNLIMGVEVKSIKKGLKIEKDKMKNVERVELGIWVKEGESKEEKESKGIENIMENMDLKGKEKSKEWKIE